MPANTITRIRHLVLAAKNLGGPALSAASDYSLLTTHYSLFTIYLPLISQHRHQNHIQRLPVAHPPLPHHPFSHEPTLLVAADAPRVVRVRMQIDPPQPEALEAVAQHRADRICPVSP